MLSGERDHIVLVQYLNVVNQSPRSVSQPSFLFSPSSTGSLSSPPSTKHEPIVIGGGYESRINLTSPVSVETVSEDAISKNVVESFNITSETVASNIEVTEALRRLEEQLSPDIQNLNELSSFGSQDERLKSSNSEDYGIETSNHGRLDVILDASDHTALGTSYCGVQDGVPSMMHGSGDSGMDHQQISSYEEPGKDKNSFSWTDVVDFEDNISRSREGAFPQNNSNIEASFSSFTSSQLSNLSYFPQNNSNIEGPFSSFTSSRLSNLSYQGNSFDTDKTFIPPQVYSNITIAQNQKFSIRDVSPQWGYSFETTKVIIVGSLLCNPSEHVWTCMFGDFEVPIQIIQEGVFLCEAPPMPSGKVTLCITSANMESCSEVREFEYRNKTSPCTRCSTLEKETTMSSEEMLILVRLAQILLCGSLGMNDDRNKLGNAISGKEIFDEESWSLIVDSLLDGSRTFADTMSWLLQEFLKDKLVAWLSFKTQEASGEPSCLLSTKEQGIIHLIAALGYEWPLNPILSSGVNINFRDINGWTALHWAARFGREKMVACLIASGALAGAVTDPNAQDPTGKTPASIAAINGHNGLAGYLSEAALTSHLSSLKPEVNELSEGLTVLEAKHSVSHITIDDTYTSEDQLSMQDTLAAVRNAANAAARIQAAYRAHSFRKNRRKKLSNTISIDDYGFRSDDVQGLSAVSKLAFRNKRDHNSAALAIQKNFKGYKHRKDFLNFRQKVVKIQAHVRGHQTRKNYMVCWATGILEKVILRWRRKGVGLRGFTAETIDESDEEDIARVFRKKNVEAAIEEAVSRVLSMVEVQEAQQQYRRILEGYRQAMALKGNTANKDAETCVMTNMDEC